MTYIESYRNNLNPLHIHPHAFPSLFLPFLTASLFALSLFVFLSRRPPRKHTCCTNFKSSYNGAITISPARYFTTVGMQCALSRSVCLLEIFICICLTVACFMQQFGSLGHYLLGIERFSNSFLSKPRIRTFIKQFCTHVAFYGA